MSVVGMTSLYQAYRGGAIARRTVVGIGGPSIEILSRCSLPPIQSIVTSNVVHIHHGSQNGVTSLWLNCMKLCGRMARVLDRLNENVINISHICARQCSAIAAQRLRRALQIAVLYNNLGYDHQLIQAVVRRFGATFLRKARHRPFALALGAAVFSWDSHRITEDELANVGDEIPCMRRSAAIKETEEICVKGWEKIIDKPHITAWRRVMVNTTLFEYKVYGSYDDIPPRAFYTAQVDLEFRKQWDKDVIFLNIVDKDEKSPSEVIQWIMRFPRPMGSRDYVYIRRVEINPKKNLMVIVNRSVNHPQFPPSKEHVRVYQYSSKMVIKPHTTFDENGFDYMLTYFDNPEATVPKIVGNWAANKGVADFVEKVHTAAQNINERRKTRILKGDSDASEDETRLPM